MRIKRARGVSCLLPADRWCAVPITRRISHWELDKYQLTMTIYPRSPRETMAGWVYLPRFIDKIRLHLAGKLPPDYQENFTKGFYGEGGEKKRGGAGGSAEAPQQTT